MQKFVPRREARSGLEGFEFILTAFVFGVAVVVGFEAFVFEDGAVFLTGVPFSAASVFDFSRVFERHEVDVVEFFVEEVDRVSVIVHFDRPHFF